MYLNANGWRALGIHAELYESGCGNDIQSLFNVTVIRKCLSLLINRIAMRPNPLISMRKDLFKYLTERKSAFMR